MEKPAHLFIFLKAFISDTNEEGEYQFSHEDWCDFISVAEKLHYSDYRVGKLSLNKIEIVLNPPEQDVISEALAKDASSHFIKFSFEIQPLRILDDAHYWGFADDINNRIMQLLIASTIARPEGPFGSNTVVGILNQRVIWKRQGHGMINEHLTHGVRVCSWPQYKRLSIEETLAWAQKRSGFLNKSSDNKVSRALCCFTQLFTEYSPQQDYLYLLWSMIGLEAITNSGAAGVQSSFYNRICEMLGEPKKSKNKFKDLYRERSKLIHGQYNLPAQFASGSDDLEVPEHPEELNDAQSLAISIFVGCLQYCVEKKVADITFEMKKTETFD